MATSVDIPVPLQQRIALPVWLKLSLIVLGLAMPARLFVVARAETVSRDGPLFIWYAQDLHRQPIPAMRVRDQHPLYAAMILGTHAAMQAVGGSSGGWLADPVTSWLVAAVTVTMVGGLMVVIGVYCLAHVIFDRRTALLAAVLASLAAEFCKISADALSDTTHLSLYLFAIAAGIHGLKRSSLMWLATAGALSGAAFLARPEGAEAAIVLAGVCLFASKTTVKLRATRALTVTMAALLVASPYMFLTGSLVRKKPVERLLPISQKSMSSTAPVFASTDTLGTETRASTSWSKTTLKIIEKWARALRYTYLLPVVAWLMMRKQRTLSKDVKRVIAGAMGIHLAILFLLVARFDYLSLLSLRHALILAALTLPFTAAGLVAIVDRIAPAHPRLPLIQTAFIAALVLPTTPWVVERIGQDGAACRAAGEWIRAQAGDKPRLLTRRARAAYHAHGIYIPLCRHPTEHDVVDLAQDRNAEYLVLDRKRDRDLIVLLDDELAAGGPYTKIAEFSNAPGEAPRALIYRIDRDKLTPTEVKE